MKAPAASNSNASRETATKRRRSPRLGTRGRAEWLDLSDYLVHFAKGDSGYDTIMSILWRGLIRRGEKPFGAAQSRRAVREAQRAVCFSETPLGFLQRLVERRGTSYGIGFHKKFIMAKGGAPLWYLESGSEQHLALSAMMKEGRQDSNHAIWRLTPFIDLTRTGPRGYDFRWEREWRLTSDLSFEPTDVAFLFLPESQHADAWTFFHDARDDNRGPGYFCPYIDPTWTHDQARKGLAKAAKRKPPPWPKPFTTLERWTTITMPMADGRMVTITENKVSISRSKTKG